MSTQEKLFDSLDTFRRRMRAIRESDWTADSQRASVAGSLLDDLDDLLPTDPNNCPVPGALEYEIGVKYGGGATLYRTVRADNDAVALIRALEYPSVEISAQNEKSGGLAQKLGFKPIRLYSGQKAGWYVYAIR